MQGGVPLRMPDGCAFFLQAMDVQGTWRLKMPRLAKVHKFHWFLSKTCPFNSYWNFDRKNLWPASADLQFRTFSPRTFCLFVKVLQKGMGCYFTLCMENI